MCTRKGKPLVSYMILSYYDTLRGWLSRLSMGMTQKRLLPIFNTSIADIIVGILQQILEGIKTSFVIVFDYSMKKDLISQNYAKYIRSPKFETTTTTCTLTANDIQVISKKDDLPMLILPSFQSILDYALMSCLKHVLLMFKADASKNRIISIPY